MQTINKLIVISILISSLAACSGDKGDTTKSGTWSAYGKYVDEMGNISLPDNFLETWVHLGAWALVEDNLVPDLHSVYAPIEAVEFYKEHGDFADGTMLIKEVRHARGSDHTTGRAFWATDEVIVWFVMVKDTQNRFPDNPIWGEGWGWGLFNGGDRETQVATDYTVDCLGCHVPAEHLDYSYIYAYPVLGERVIKHEPEGIFAGGGYTASGAKNAKRDDEVREASDGSVSAAQAQKKDEEESNYGVSIIPEWNEKGELIRPKGFRHTWVYLGAPFTPHSLNDGAAGFPEFHNVYVQPDAFHAYRATGKWPEGTMMLKELQLVDDPEGDEDDGSRYEPSGRGFFPGPVNGIDVAVKDSKRFAETKNWGYFNFGHHAPPYKETAAAAPKEECAQCHIDSEGDEGTEDMVFINMYRPILTPLPN